MRITRGVVIAALVAAALIRPLQGAQAAAQAQPASLPAGESVLADGLTVAVRRATLSPTAALEVWIVCPSDGYILPRPGIARLTALSIVATKVNGISLRDAVRATGGQLSVSVFPGSTQISVMVPADTAEQLLDTLLARVLHPTIDTLGFTDAKLRMAEQQVIAATTADVLLRDGIFNQLFADGPFHVSTYGGTSDLRALTITDAQSYAAKAYVASNAIVVAVGGTVDEAALTKRIADAAPNAGASNPLPASTRAPAPSKPFDAGFADTGGVALGWVGPAVQDERTSTAMDFISDYLTRPDYGLVANAVRDGDPAADFNGQFITLRDAGVFYMTVTGGKLDRDTALQLMRNAMHPLVDRPLPAREFARALEAFRVHTLRDTQTPQQLADNYGWYFAQGAPAYAPSVTDLGLHGDYYGQAAALTADTVYKVAKQYLGANALVATVAPRPQSPPTTSYVIPRSRARVSNAVPRSRARGGD